MRPNSSLICRFLRLFVLFLTLPILASGQAKFIPPRITELVDETKLTPLRGNTHPLTRPEFDTGGAPPSLPMERMLLVLKRSPEQEAALQELLDEQQDKSSPNYHKWLTPEQFGQQFGPSDQDIQTVTSWLQSHGFQIAQVAKGRTVVEFSGTAAQVQEAFHTAIRKYVVNGKEHWANASDPEIPAALTPVVAGVATLHNFGKKPHIRISDKRIAARFTPGAQPRVSFSGGVHALGPADYAVIYNIQPLYNGGINGAGTTIAVVGRTDFNVQDVRDFRNVFGLPANDPQIILNGPDPGNLGGGEEVEAVLDASWSGAVAPNATVKFVASATTNTTDGVNLSVLYIIDNNLANVMTESFGICEANITAAEAANEAAIAGQGAAQGITYMVSSGDSGAEDCDEPGEPQAQRPISVDFPASLPYTVAVGGTIFNEHGNDSAFWKTTNNQNTLESAISYIPENVWNESCSVAQCGNNANLAAGGGGASGVIAPFFFSKPIWQSGLPGIPVDGRRDVPDVALSAAAGHDPYLLCIFASCQPDSQGNIGFFAVGGTSASAPSFAAIMALVNQKTASRQGQANYVLYRLAASENLSQCNASNISGLPAGDCIFNDVTVGNNAVPGETGFGTSSAKYQSNLGYDLASGLGSVNAANLVNKWGSVRVNGTTTTLAITPAAPTPIPHGTAAGVSITVAPKTPATGTPSGNVSLLTSNGQGVAFFALDNGSIASITDQLPGGTYSVTARYAGDSTFAPSDSGPVSVIVSPEVSFTLVKVFTADTNGGLIPLTTTPYGSLVFLRADVRGFSGNGIATGNVNFADNGTVPNVPGDPYPLNSEGNTVTPNGLFTFPAGPHSLAGKYSGDPSFNPSTSIPVSFTITQAPTTTSLSSSATRIAPGTSVTLSARVSSDSHGNPPTGTVTFFSGTTRLGSPVAVTGGVVSKMGAQAIASLTTSLLPAGQDSVTARYSGDTNYSASTSPPIVITVAATPDFTVSANPTTIIIPGPGSPGKTTLTIAGQNGYNGTITFSSASCSNLPPESGCNFNPDSVTGSGTAALTIVTTAPHSAGIIPSRHDGFGWWMASGGATLACVFLLGVPAKRRRWNVFLGLMVVVFLAMFAACGGGGGPRDPGTPTGQRTVTVTLTSGAIAHTVDLTLIVQ